MGGKKQTWIEKRLGGEAAVSPSMAEGSGEAQGTIAVVLGMAGGWAGGGMRSHGGCPQGEAGPLPTGPPTARPPAFIASQPRCFSGWLVTKAEARWGEVGPTEEVALATGAPGQGFDCRASHFLLGAEGSDIALPLQQLNGNLVHKIIVALYIMPETTTKSYILNRNKP